jgi:predicted aconitase
MAVSLELTNGDRDLLAGESGEASRLAMRIVVAMAEALGADRLIDVTSAHVDGCLYHGQVSLDFAERLSAAGATVAVPTTLNVGSLDLLHSDRFRGDPESAERGRQLMDLYAGMGCRPTWTCAPYQVAGARPRRGEHVAWAESNAIVFVNSVVGARTERYGDFIDICAAITGRVPDAGLHRTENRGGRILFRLTGIADQLVDEELLYPVLGHIVGSQSGARVPVIEGLAPDTSEDDLKALGATAASSGSVGMFHAVGVTPEAATVDQALRGKDPEEVMAVTPAMLRAARDSLATASGDRIDAVSVGTPHFSESEFERLQSLLDRRTVRVPFYVSTGRDVLARVEARGWLDALEASGVTLVTDTCTYVTPILRPGVEVVMTNSGKWAYYAPGNIGVEVILGTLEECVRSATEGRVWRDPDVFTGR